jgi:G3E family GTPase
VLACLDVEAATSPGAERPEFIAQLAMADRIVLTKLDHGSCAAGAARLLARALNPEAQVSERPATPADLSALFEPRATPAAQRAPNSDRPRHEAVDQLIIRPPCGAGPEVLLRIAALCERGGDALFRLKGVLRDHNGAAVAINAVAGLLYPPVALPTISDAPPVLIVIGRAGLAARLAPLLDGWNYWDVERAGRHSERLSA